jgi:hypothetical protein
MRKWVGLALSCALCLVVPRGAGAAVQVDLGTAANAAAWSVTGAGAAGSPAFAVSANGAGEISLTSNASKTGTFVAGGSLANFNGFWYADETFALPANATGVSLSFDSLFGNDRAVLQLNGVTIGNVDHLGATGSAVMSFPPGPPDVAYTITGTTSGVINSGFVLGGSNTLRIIVNNTGVVPITAPTATFGGTGDVTDAHLNATLTYNVPEPSALGLLALGSTLCLARRKR